MHVLETTFVIDNEPILTKYSAFCILYLVSTVPQRTITNATLSSGAREEAWARMTAIESSFNTQHTDAHSGRFAT